MGRSIPNELKVAYYNNGIHPTHMVVNTAGTPAPECGMQFKTPTWWTGSTVLGVFDKLMQDKVGGVLRLGG